jgi:zinc transport system substrate-binding protein
VFKLMDCVDLVEEELVEGMQPEAEESESSTQSETEETPEMDEHVWTAPANAMKIVQKLSDTLCTLDSANQDTYKANTKTYLAQLQKLDDDFRQVIDNSKRKEIIVGDRFPFRYFCEEFGLTYYAAFPGCSTDTEADASTVAFLIDKVKEDQIPIVFHIELSNEQMCDSICEATGAKSELLNAVHNVSDSDFKAGVTYVSLMEHNVEVLKEALN